RSRLPRPAGQRRPPPAHRLHPGPDRRRRQRRPRNPHLAGCRGSRRGRVRHARLRARPRLADRHRRHRRPALSTALCAPHLSAHHTWRTDTMTKLPDVTGPDMRGVMAYPPTPALPGADRVDATDTVDLAETERMIRTL